MSYFNNDHYNSYYYANIIDNILTDDIELIGFISQFHEAYGTSVLKSFEKTTAFHAFIALNIRNFFLDDMSEHDEKEYKISLVNPPLGPLYAEWPLKNYGLDFSFAEFIEDKEEITWEDIEAYHDDLHLIGYLEELFDKIAEEVFYLLFNNRDLLTRFNLIMARYVSDITLDSLEEDEEYLFLRDGRLKRTELPEWVKNAVFFRDRGHCCGCKKDVSSLLNLSEQKHYDHIVPLAEGGLNDITNIQLLCKECNLSKSNKEIYTSRLYEKWY